MHHKFAVVVQDVAGRWIQSHPCETMSAQETHRSLRNCLRPQENPRSIHTDNALIFLKACDELNWMHQRVTPHRSETSGTTERAVRGVKEGTLSFLVQSGLQESWCSEASACRCQMARRFMNVRSIHDLTGPIAFGSEVNFSALYLHKTKVECISSVQSPSWNMNGIRLERRDEVGLVI